MLTYKILTNTGINDLEREINDLASEGWVLHTYASHKYGSASHFVVMQKDVDQYVVAKPITDG